MSLWMGPEDQSMLGRIYFRSALLGECLFYPSNHDELKWYFFRKSSVFRVFVDACILMTLLVPLISNKQCVFHDMDAPTTRGAEVALLLCCLVQVFDVWLCFKTTNWTGWAVSPSIVMDYSLHWEYLRLLCCGALIINSLCALVDQSTPRLAMALIPVLVMARRDDFKQLLQGILHSMRKIAKFAKLWVLFVLVWAFMGLCLFRRYTANPDQVGVRYSTYWEALYTTMHCMLSRPTVLYRLKPIFPENNYSAFYFVSLTTIGDILLTTAIIAMGTRQFRDFSQEVFRFRSKYRRVALHALFAIYNNDSDSSRSSGMKRCMTVNSWVSFCAHLGPYYKLNNPNDAIALFSTEDHLTAGHIDERAFVRLCGALSTRLLMFTKGFILPYQQRLAAMKTLRTTQGNAYDSMDRYSASTREVTLIYQRSLSVDAKKRLSVGQDVAAAKRASFNIMAHIEEENKGKRNSKRITSTDTNFTTATGFTTTLLHPEIYTAFAFEAWDSAVAEFWANPKLSAYYEILCQFCVDVLHLEITFPVPDSWYASKYAVLMIKWLATIRRRERISSSNSAADMHSVISDGDSLKEYNYYAVVDAFQQFRRLLIFLMLIQVSLLAARTPGALSLAFTWILFFLFIFEALILCVASQTPKLDLRLLVMLDFATFVCLCALGSDTARLPPTALTIYIILQAVRLTRFFLNSDSMRIFHAIVPVLLRVMCIYMLTLYSFAVLGNITLCHQMSSSEVLENNNDDDSNSWVNFDNLLNFNTFFSAYYTMAASAILSNWSMILDAALDSTDTAMNAWIYIYFYAFRGFIVVLVIPLMMSCIIQTFIQQLNKKVVVKHRDRKKMGLEYYHITGKDIGNDTILSLWLPNGQQKKASADKVYDIAQDKNKSGLLKYDKFASKVRLQPSSNSAVAFEREYLAGRESIAMVGNSGHFADALAASEPAEPTEPPAMRLQRSLSRAPKLNDYAVPAKLIALLTSKQVLFRVTPASMIAEQCQLVYNVMHHKEAHGLDKLTTVDYVMFAHCKSTLSQPSQLKVACLWLMDSLRGAQINYPISDSQLASLQILKSRQFSAFIYVITILQVMAIFLVVPRCLLTSSPEGAGKSAIPRLALNIFDIICAFFYLIEACLHIHAIESPQLAVARAADSAERRTAFTVLTQSWTGLRVLCTLLIVIKGIVPIAQPSNGLNNIRLVRCIFPVLLVTRNDNYIDIMKGIGLSFRESKPVYKLFATIIFLFSFVGYWLFHRLQTDADRFENLPMSFLTVLHCATAAPFSLYVLTPYFSDYSMLSPVFFLILSYVIEVLCVNLIVAAGSVHFNKYGEEVLRMRMTRRYDALLAIWCLLRDQDHMLSLAQWVRFTQTLPEEHYISEEVAVLLFLYVLQQHATEGVDKDKEEQEEVPAICLEQFTALLYLILNGVRCRPHRHEHLHADTTAPRPLSTSSSVEGITSSEVEMTVRTSEVVHVSPLHPATPLPTPLPSEPCSAVYDIYYLQEGVRGEPKPPSASASCRAACGSAAEEVYRQSKVVCGALLEANVLGWSFLGVFTVVMHLLLLLQLSFFTSMTLSSLPWLRFGYFLEVMFWIEMIVYLVGLGLRRYLRDSVHLSRATVNIGSLGSMIALAATSKVSGDSSGDQTHVSNTLSAAFLLLVLFQCLRLGLVCVRVRGHGRYRIIIENTFRAFFLFFLVLYFFTILAQTAFCGVLTSDDSSTSTTSSGSFTDDDASSWDQFSAILNFNNYAQAIFTLFEVSVLGSWSIVMDATVQHAERGKLATQAFFFAFRLLIVLMVLPLLVSFMIRSFIALNDRVSVLHKDRRKRREAQQMQRTAEGVKDKGTQPSSSTPSKTRWRYYAVDMDWLTFTPQRRERRLRMHSAFLDIWDTSMSWIQSKHTAEYDRYRRTPQGVQAGGHGHGEGSDSDGELTDDDYDDAGGEDGDREDEIMKMGAAATIQEEDEEEEEEEKEQS